MGCSRGSPRPDHAAGLISFSGSHGADPFSGGEPAPTSLERAATDLLPGFLDSFKDKSAWTYFWMVFMVYRYTPQAQRCWLPVVQLGCIC